MEIIDICSIPLIAVLCYVAVEIIKKHFDKYGNLKELYPMISAILGSIIGVIIFLTDSRLIFVDSLIEAAIAGMASGLSATGGNEIIQRILRHNKMGLSEMSSARYYITGDKHRNFNDLIRFCKEHHLQKNDVIIILGDAGFNYYSDSRDDKLKAKLSKTDVTLFCLHGNKENRPENISTYGIRTFCGGTVYYEPQYPHIYFAKDGEVYNFNGKEFIVIGGAHSVDKVRCIEKGLPFWEDEMPSDEVKKLVEEKLAARENKIFGFLTHTCPESCLPIEMFVSTLRAASKKKTKKKDEYPIDIDRSTEKWLDILKEKNEYSTWYCGHYHIDKDLEKVHMMKNAIIPLCYNE